MVGSVDIDDGTNSRFDFATETFAQHNSYVQHVLASGLLTKTRSDLVAAVVTAQGMWFDTASKRLRHDFKDALLAVDGAAMDLKDGLAYAAVDVIDFVETNVGICGNSSGVLLKAYRWTIKIQCHSGVRT